MICLNRLKPGAMLLMVGLLPLATSQAQAQSTSAASLLGSTVIALPSDTMNTDNDSNNDMLGAFNLGDADLLGTQDVTTLSHGGSGISSGWILGGALGAAAGVAGLASGGGSSAAALLRTPASPVGPTFATELGTPSTIAGNTVTVSNGNTSLTGGGVNAGNGSAGSGSGSGVGSGSGAPGVNGGSTIGNVGTVNSFQGPSGGGFSGGGIGPQAVVPEPGTMALFGGMGLMLTAAKLRRRKR